MSSSFLAYFFYNKYPKFRSGTLAQVWTSSPLAVPYSCRDFRYCDAWSGWSTADHGLLMQSSLATVILQLVFVLIISYLHITCNCISPYNISWNPNACSDKITSSCFGVLEVDLDFLTHTTFIILILNVSLTRSTSIRKFDTLAWLVLNLLSPKTTAKVRYS